jgi:glycosyltransferase involved in cell wall biosynthesis
MALVISAVVHTRNEERNLPYALRSIRPWVDEIVVVDMESTDGTVAIAERAGARVVAHPPMGFADPARAFGCAQTRGEWILVLDADELVPPALARRLSEVAQREEADAVRIPRLNYLLGGPLLHSGWNPPRDRHVRFFRRGVVTISGRLHEGFRPVDGATVLDLDARAGHVLVHFNYLDTAQFVDRLNRYTTIEAEQARMRGERATPGRALWRAGREWLARYGKHRGYRDGWRGFSLSVCMAFYRFVADAKLIELERVGRRAEIELRYRQEAERILSGVDDPLAVSDRAGRLR